MRRSAASVAIVLVAMRVGAGAAGARAHSTRTAHGLGALVPRQQDERLPLHGGTADSLNWSGYAVTPSGGGVTAVSSTFTVPSTGLVPPGFAATWTGIGGYNTGDLIQAGTAEQSAPDNPLVGPQHYAWYERLPASENQLTGYGADANCTVTPGDAIGVDISLLSGNTLSISMTDSGHWNWSKDVTYSSSESSGEWITEAPTLLAQTLLAPVGTVPVGPTSTYTASGATHTTRTAIPPRSTCPPGSSTRRRRPRSPPTASPSTTAPTPRAAWRRNRRRVRRQDQV
jgi:hypothetical protein